MKVRIPRIVEAITPLVAIIVIWRLVTTALDAGVDGVMFFGGVAAIAGLGGFEIKEWVVRRATKTSEEEKQK